MFKAILAYLHCWANYGLALCKMAKNREIGWVTIDRKTGEYKREQQPLMKKLKLLFLFNPLMECLDNTRLFRHYLHEKADMEGHKMSEPSSATKIKSFVDFYHINMSDFTPSDPAAYRTFQDFFTRKHAAGARPIHAQDNPAAAIIPADCRVVVYTTVPRARALWIKGKHFTISNLVDDEKRGHVWDQGSIASFRLSPQDYHRYHCPVDGTVKWWKQIAGDYYGVDPLAIGSDVDVLTSNARCAVEIESERFGGCCSWLSVRARSGLLDSTRSSRLPDRALAKGRNWGCLNSAARASSFASNGEGSSSITILSEPVNAERRWMSRWG